MSRRLTRMLKALSASSVAAIGIAVLWLNGPVEARQAPNLPDLLRLAGEYQSAYVNRVSGVSLEEQYQLIDVTGGKMQGVIRISSDVVFVNLNGGVTALRDVFAIDTKPVRERTPRIAALLGAPATPTLKDWETVIRYPAQGSVYFALDIILKVNEPTTALRFIAPSVQETLKYSLDGQKKLNGVQTVGLRFEEPAGQQKKYLLATRANGRASGRFWIDPVSGAVHQTELWVDSKGESANITVKYAPNAALNLVLPAETTETYEEREAATGPRDDARAAGGGQSGSRISFQASAKYSKPTYAAIDLRTLKR